MIVCQCEYQVTKHEKIESNSTLKGRIFLMFMDKIPYLKLKRRLIVQGTYKVENLAKIYPQRIEAIEVRTISPCTFLIAGRVNLIKDKAIFSLKGLYKFLEKRNVLVLYPKEYKSKEMGLEVNNLALRAGMEARLPESSGKVHKRDMSAWG